MLLTQATTHDFPAICALYEAVCADMLAKVLNQWHWGQYPNEDLVRASLEAGTLYVCREGDDLLCAVTVDATFEPEYAAVNWHCGVNPGTFHRIAIAPQAQDKGLGRGIMADMPQILRD